MAPPVYSIRFIAATVNPGSTYTYTVPPGYRAIVREVTGRLINDDTTQNQTVSCYIGLLDGITFPIIENWEAAAGASGSTPWEGRAIAEAGETIYIENVNAALWTGTVSGYLLALP